MRQTEGRGPPVLLYLCESLPGLLKSGTAGNLLQHRKGLEELRLWLPDDGQSVTLTSVVLSAMRQL